MIKAVKLVKRDGTVHVGKNFSYAIMYWYSNYSANVFAPDNEHFFPNVASVLSELSRKLPFPDIICPPIPAGPVDEDETEAVCEKLVYWLFVQKEVVDLLIYK